MAKSRQPWQTRALEAAVNTAKNCPIVALQHGKVEHYSVVVGAVVLLVWCGCQNSKERAKNIIAMACHYGIYLEVTFNEGSQLRYHLKSGSSVLAKDHLKRLLQELSSFSTHGYEVEQR